MEQLRDVTDAVSIRDGWGRCGEADSAVLRAPRLTSRWRHGKGVVGPTAFANAYAIRDILKRERTDVKVFEYEGGTHGFAGPTASDTKAAVDSKGETIKFFETRL